MFLHLLSFCDFVYWNCIKAFICLNLFSGFLNSMRWILIVSFDFLLHWMSFKVTQVSFNKPSCCIGFAETASQNMVSERFALLFFLILIIWNVHLYSPTLLLVEFYLILVELCLIMHMKLLHYIIRERSFLVFLYI